MTNDKQKQKTKPSSRIYLKLQEGRTCEFIFSDEQLAKEYFQFLRALGTLGSVAIRDISFQGASSVGS